LKVTVFEMLRHNTNCMHYAPWSYNATVYNYNTNTPLQQTDNICILDLHTISDILLSNDH
jgi:hypothetical protein